MRLLKEKKIQIKVIICNKCRTEIVEDRTFLECRWAGLSHHEMLQTMDLCHKCAKEAANLLNKHNFKFTN